MIIQALEKINVADTLSQLEKQQSALRDITFEPSNIIAGDGLTISITGYVIVFLSLVLLSIFVSKLKDILTVKQRKKLKAEGHRAADVEDLNIPGEINAAIAMAIHLHYAEVHDFENTVLTIEKVQRPYSPWSSKLYGLRQTPNK